MSTRLLHELTRRLPAPTTRPCLDELRRVFSELMDQAAQALQLAGYQQDDGLIERWVELRCPGDGRTDWIEVQSLTNMDRFLSPWALPASRAAAPGTNRMESFGENGLESDDGRLLPHIVSVRVRVVLEEGVPFGPK